MSGTGRRPARGFSLLELIVVVAIILVVAAVAIPQVMVATQNFKLRSTASSLSGLMQKCRMLAVARNTFNRVTYSSGSYSCTVTSVENANPILLPSTIVPDSSGGGFSRSSMNLSYDSTSTIVVGQLPVFTPRGLPCVLQSGGACTVTGQGYVYYLRQDRAIGSSGWAAVTVSPAGRVQVWTWSGSSWQ